jgi:hypothetical protein
MTVQEIESVLDRELAFVREKARVDGGWAEVLERYQIQTLAPKKPSAQQLRVVVNGLVMQAAAALEQSGDKGPVAFAFWQRLCQVVESEGRAHQDFLGPLKPRSKLLGNILHNATASVNEEFWTQFKWNERIVALCKTCGAPQQKSADYKCKYCGGDMFKGMEFPQ